jgi:hypothetical protein
MATTQRALVAESSRPNKERALNSMKASAAALGSLIAPCILLANLLLLHTKHVQQGSAVKKPANALFASGRLRWGRWAKYNENAGHSAHMSRATWGICVPKHCKGKTRALASEGGEEGSASYRTSSGVKSLGMLKRCRISSGVLHCLMYSATVLQVRSSRSFTSRKLAACRGEGEFCCLGQHTSSRSPHLSA